MIDAKLLQTCRRAYTCICTIVNIHIYIYRYVWSKYLSIWQLNSFCSRSLEYFKIIGLFCKRALQNFMPNWRICICISTWYIYSYIYIHIHTCMFMYHWERRTWASGAWAHVEAAHWQNWRQIGTHIYLHTSHAYINIFIYTCTYVCDTHLNVHLMRIHHTYTSHTQIYSVIRTYACICDTYLHVYVIHMYIHTYMYMCEARAWAPGGWTHHAATCWLKCYRTAIY